MATSLFPELAAAPRKRPAAPMILSYPGSWTQAAAEKIEAAGGRLRLLSPQVTQKELIRLYRAADGILLLGGRDVDPAYYGEENRSSQTPDKARDRIEYQLAAAALIDEKPLMGICRGHQMIAVAAGAALYQDIEAELGVPHRQDRHLIHFREARLRTLFSAPSCVVNSYHHQAVASVPKGFTLEALSAEGLIEALSAPQVRSVQWHPEILGGSQQELFRWLVNAARLAKNTPDRV